MLTAICLLAAVALAVATLLPLIDSPRWWIRAAEFPRVQIAVLCLPVIAVSALVGGWAWLAALVALAALVWQATWIWPYTPLSRREMQAAAPGDGDVRFMASNVLMENDDHQAVRDEIRRSDPDVLLLMETDDTWAEALAEELARYPTVVSRPLGNHYGMILATRLETRNAEMVQLTEDVTPTAFAEMVAPNGQAFRFIGLHPVPPVPGEDAEARDAQVLYAARFAHNSSLPVVAMGDFNTAAWSRTAHRFKSGGGYLDPRIGRGMLSSFDVKSRFLRLPIDQFYVTADVVLVSYGPGPDVGSDHFPMHARVRFDAAEAAGLNREVVGLPEAEEARVVRLVEAHGNRLKAAAAPPS